MSGKELIELAVVLKPEERFLVVEGTLESLDAPDKTIDAIWADEAERRLHAYRKGKLQGIQWKKSLEINSYEGRLFRNREA